jgi:hypothetical protein
MFWKKKAPLDHVWMDLDLSDQVPEKVWVNLFLLDMFRSKRESVTLNRSQGIPSIPLEDEVPEGGLDFDKIMNRLKVMSGLDPIVYRTRREGKFSLGVSGIYYTARTTFVDSDKDSMCTITISKGKV